MKVNEARTAVRKARTQEAHRLYKEGRLAEADAIFQTCCEVTPDMAGGLMQALRRCNIDFVVAPYEADAQLAFLGCSGQVDAVITEDSDLLVFGAPEVLFKLDLDGCERTIPANQPTRFNLPICTCFCS